jgi:hypothetical protein
MCKYSLPDMFLKHVKMRVVYRDQVLDPAFGRCELKVPDLFFHFIIFIEKCFRCFPCISRANKSIPVCSCSNEQWRMQHVPASALVGAAKESLRLLVCATRRTILNMLSIIYQTEFYIVNISLQKKTAVVLRQKRKFHFTKANEINYLLSTAYATTVASICKRDNE